MQIVDANIVLRYVLDDHPELSEQARAIIDGQAVTVPIEVLCEVVYVLRGVYNVSRVEVSAELINFFADTGCEIPHHNTVMKGLELFAVTNIDFVDCILAGYCECAGAKVHTFDKKLQKLVSRAKS